MMMMNVSQDQPFVSTEAVVRLALSTIAPGGVRSKNF
jgi:hypothetical protein